MMLMSTCLQYEEIVEDAINIYGKVRKKKWMTI